jgi:hypothetical protein
MPHGLSSSRANRGDDIAVLPKFLGILGSQTHYACGGFRVVSGVAYMNTGYDEHVPVDYWAQRSKDDSRAGMVIGIKVAITDSTTKRAVSHGGRPPG